MDFLRVINVITAITKSFNPNKKNNLLQSKKKQKIRSLIIPKMKQTINNFFLSIKINYLNSQIFRFVMNAKV